MKISHTEHYTVRNYEVGPRLTAHLRTLLDYLQETADGHVRSAGIPIEELMKKGYLWVLAAYRIDVKRYPAAGEEVTVETWYPGRTGRFYLRDFEITSPDGAGLAAATTSWALIDIKSKRPVINDDSISGIPPVERRAINHDFARLPAADDRVPGEPFTVPAGCIDMYRHANHVNSFQWAMDSISPGFQSTMEIASAEAFFRAEILEGDRLTVSTAPAGENSFLHFIVREGDGVEVTRLKTVWRRHRSWILDPGS